MKKIALITSCIFILIIAGSAAAGHHKKMRGPNSDNRQYRNDVVQSLNLSSEQVEKFKDIRKKHFEQTKDIRNEIYNKKAELDMLWNQVDPDAQVIKNKTNEIYKLNGQLNEMSVDLRLECRKILTTEQLNLCLAGGKCGFGMNWGSGMEFGGHRKFK